ncbi:MAG: MoaD/ThiS family protein [Flavobacteriaceae bacterium]|nr:MoaD/ThiS family protein [Flavobacteriaceae bacterium]
MTIKLLFFGITQDLVGNHIIDLNIENSISVVELKSELFKQYPNLNKFPNFAVAVNEQYANEETLINDKDIVAIIPPVSGG